MSAQSNFSGLMPALREFLLSRWKPPFQFNECRISNYTNHVISEYDKFKPYSVEFDGDVEVDCQYEDSNGEKFLGSDISRLYLETF